MNIYAEEGDKVIFLGLNGRDYEREEALNILEIGKVYTVDYTNVGSWCSEVKLYGVKNLFNTVMFKDSNRS